MGILGWSSWSSSHSPHESVGEIRLCPGALGACSTWVWSCRISCDEEDDGFFWSDRLLHVLLRSYPHKRQLHESNLRGIENDIRLLDARFVEADSLHETTVSRVHRLPRSVEDSFHGTVRDGGRT